MRQPDLEDGIEYWNTREASYDGVLGLPFFVHFVKHLLICRFGGGFGNGV